MNFWSSWIQWWVGSLAAKDVLNFKMFNKMFDKAMKKCIKSFKFFFKTDIPDTSCTWQISVLTHVILGHQDLLINGEVAHKHMVDA